MGKPLKSFLRKFLSVRKHFIMKCDSNKKSISHNNVGFEVVKVKNESDLIDGTYSVGVQKRIIRLNPNLVETYVLKREGIPIGCASVIFKGGKEIEYKIQEIDAFIYNVMIKPEYRGNGYVGLLLGQVIEELANTTNDVYLAVSRDNKSAIKAYEKIGFDIVDSKQFVRIIKHNIPYYCL